MSSQLQQQKLSFHSSGRVEAKRSGPASKPRTTISPTLLHSHRRRRKVGGINEIDVIRAFQQSCAHRDAGEPDSDASLDDDDGPRIKLQCTGYSREKKL
jgi:transposase-like protein